MLKGRLVLYIADICISIFIFFKNKMFVALEKKCTSAGRVHLFRATLNSKQYPHVDIVFGKLFLSVSVLNSGDFFFLTVVSLHSAVRVSADIDTFVPILHACDPLQVHFPEVEKVDWVNKVGY